MKEEEAEEIIVKDEQADKNNSKSPVRNVKERNVGTKRKSYSRYIIYIYYVLEAFYTHNNAINRAAIAHIPLINNRHGKLISNRRDKNVKLALITQII